MTSDAKIGLLLGLIFIFIIAFVINGLPGLHKKDDGNKLTTTMVGLQNRQSGLGANERKLALEIAPAAAPASGEQSRTTLESAPSAEQPASSADTRFTMALPQGAPTGTAAAAAGPTISNSTQSAPAVNIQPAPKTESARPAAPKVYVVQEGDTLSSIAKKVYGEQQGNKLTTINAIFEANRVILKTADELYVGQKLVMPALPGSTTASPAAPGVLSGPAFTKVGSIGKRHLPANADKQASAAKTGSSKTGRIYVVKEGDSLWRIAADQLGDGNRYKEIVRLNSDILSSEDDIQVDMKLKLPAK
jgi:nucleoid-associated protein YgaU